MSLIYFNGISEIDLSNQSPRVYYIIVNYEQKTKF